jgi:hypothetical protein
VPVFIVLVAIALGRLRAAGLALAAVLCAAQLQAVPFWRPTVHAERWPEAADLLRAHARPGDTVLLLPMEGLLMLRHHGWEPAGQALFGVPDIGWYGRFPGRVLARAEEMPAPAPGGAVWIVTRRATARHAAAVAALAPARQELRLLRGWSRENSGLDVSVMQPR